MTSNHATITYLRTEPADATTGELRGCVRMYDALLEILKGSGPLNMGVTDDELLAILTRGDQAASARSISRWKGELRDTQPPAIYTKVTNNRTFYRLRVTHGGLLKLVAGGEPVGDPEGERGDPHGDPMAIRGASNARERSSSSSSPSSPASPGLATDPPRVATTRSATGSPSLSIEDYLDGGLLQWAGIDDTPLATYKLSLLPDLTAKRAVMRTTVLQATKSRPGYLCEVVDTWLQAMHRGEYGAVEDLLDLPSEASDELSLREPAIEVPRPAPSSAQTSPTDRPETRRYVRGAAPRAGSNLTVAAREAGRRLALRGLTALTRWLEESR